jgi:hypothetical protein
MDLYRVTWVDHRWRSLTPFDPFHPLYVPVDLQGGGRFDNPGHYAALYGSSTAAGAVGETFGNSATWLESELTRQKEGHPRCLVHFAVPDDTVLVDLDDSKTLTRLDLKPSDVVRRNRDRTQELGLSIWLERDRLGARGIRWWSYWRPEWIVVVLWTDGLAPPWFPFATVVDVEPLHPDHPAVVLAADGMPREIA